MNEKEVKANVRITVVHTTNFPDWVVASSTLTKLIQLFL